MNDAPGWGGERCSALAPAAIQRSYKQEYEPGYKYLLSPMNRRGRPDFGGAPEVV